MWILDFSYVVTECYDQLLAVTESNTPSSFLNLKDKIWGRGKAVFLNIFRNTELPFMF